ncbi:MAG: hypothetical protein GTO18_22140 [Anaerolineales bacterium]|nr:hypothetical protein [Anaerolineales bacterium]
MIRKLSIPFLLILLILLVGGSVATAQGPGAPERTPAVSNLGSTFTYQGRLTDGGSPANGTYDFEFKLFDDNAGGSQIGGTVNKDDVAVSDGFFTALLNFGDAFNGTARWLEIGVRPGASVSSYTTLDPRQELTPVPYALALPSLWTEQNATSPNLIGGHYGNETSSGVVGATISGGGSDGLSNIVTDDYGTIGGGSGNQAGDGGPATEQAYATVGGGNSNTASALYSTVGGGRSNTAGDYSSTVSGGDFNTASEEWATIGGGGDNTAAASGAMVGGGRLNSATGGGTTIGGGFQNNASAPYSTVGGGTENSASGMYASIPGGYKNSAAGHSSFAAGRNAKANANGCFVWGDYHNFDLTCENTNRWLARASGGVFFYTNYSLSQGVFLAPNGNAWNSFSDRATKENFTPVDRLTLLENLAAMPIQEYNLKGQNPSIRHFGPVAQDFNAAFGYGESETAINMEDADGVAMAAIQGLYQLVQEKDAQIETLQQQNSDLEARLEKLEKSVGTGSTQDNLIHPTTWLILGGLCLAGAFLGGRWISGGRR